MMRNWIAAVGLAAGLCVAGAARAETLADAMIAAYKTSNLLEQNRAVLRAADEDAAAAFAKLMPVLAYSAQKSSAFSSSAPNVDINSEKQSLSLSLTLYAGNRGRNGVALAREAVMATRASLQNIESQVLLSAVTAYVNVGLKAEIVRLRESNVRLITQQLRASQDRFAVGEVTLTDVSLAESRLAAANAGLAAAQGELAFAREAYNSAIGAYPADLRALPALPALPKSLDEARAIAQTAHPSIKQAQAQVNIAELQVKIAKGGLGPTLSAQISKSRDQDRLETTVSSLQLNQTIYAGGGALAALRKTYAQKESALAQQKQASLAVNDALGRAWAGLAVANASVRAGAAQIEAAQKAFDGVREEANLGSRTTLDVLNSEQELLSARASKLEAEANRYIGVYQILAAMGQLSAEKLNLGLPVYDVEGHYNAVKNAPPLWAQPSKQGAALDRVLGAKAGQ
jgi:outer membrane protein